MYRVLIVDDDVPFLKSLQQFGWEGLGCRCVYAATNGLDALEKCAQLMPHIVITDINMPMMDGIELTRVLRERYPQIMVILLTVHQEFKYAQQAVGLGACDYLIKDTGYRQRLPQVIERAKKAFDSQWENRSAVVQSGGRLLNMDAGPDAICEELETFLESYHGTLLTITAEGRWPERRRIMRWLDRSAPAKAGWIFSGEHCLELMIPAEENVLVVWGQLSVSNDLEWNSPVRAAYSLNISTATQYREAHELNRLALEKHFYDGTKTIQQASDPGFQPLTNTKSENWLQRVMDAAADQTLDVFLNKIREECKNLRFEPDGVRQFGQDLLRQMELRWADKMDTAAHAKIMQAATVEELFAHLLSCAESMVQGSQLSYQCEKALEVMRQRLADEELSLAQVAEAVFISPGYLSKRMKEETGYTFKEMLIRLRMERAAELILQGGCKIYEIAEQTGYQNYRSFSVAFENYYGVSAKKYRG